MVFIFLNIVCFSAQMLLLGRIKTKSLSENLLITAVMTSVSGTVLCGGMLALQSTVSLYTIGCGAAFGLLFSLAVSTYSYAIATGPVSYTTFIYSGSMLLPTIAGIILWREPLTGPVAVGLLLFLLAFYFISVKGGNSAGKPNTKWMTASLLSFLLSGCSSLSIKVHQMRMEGSEALNLVGIGLMMAGVFSFLFYALCIVKRNQDNRVRQHILMLKQNVFAILTMAVCTGVGNMLYTYLASLVASAYLFPLIAGGDVVLVTLISVLFLKEKVNKAGVMGIITGILAIIILNI